MTEDKLTDEQILKLHKEGAFVLKGKDPEILHDKNAKCTWFIDYKDLVEIKKQVNGQWVTVNDPNLAILPKSGGSYKRTCPMPELEDNVPVQYGTPPNKEGKSFRILKADDSNSVWIRATAYEFKNGSKIAIELQSPHKEPVVKTAPAEKKTETNYIQD